MPKFLKKGNKCGWTIEGFKDLFDEDLDSLCHSPGVSIIKDQKRIMVCKAGWHGEDIYVKRYNSYSLWSRLEGTIFGSKASRSWEGATILAENGFGTAEPLAAIECKRFGLTEDSFYITKEIKDSRISVHYYKEEILGKKAPLKRRRAFLRSLAGLFRGLHEKGIYHNDLKDYNILVKENGERWLFYLLDLEGVKKYKKLPFEKSLINLVQIYRTLGNHLTWPDKVSFFKEYKNDNDWKGIVRDVVDKKRLEDDRKERRVQGLKK